MIDFAGARSIRFVAIMAAALAISACSKKPGDDPNAGLNPNGVAGRAIPGSPQDFVVNVGDRVFFETDSSELTPTAQATLSKQASWLNRYSRYSIRLEGHADERGTREYNFALGARRASVTKNFLVAQGVPGSRIHTTSYGKERPVAVCNDISCWSQNRRAVTVPTGSGS
ncbi:MAG: peptidoglycan-associated lipoprotein Pal [Beijerinckiaceae bacterium]